MEKTATQLTLKWWPTPQDYNEAVQIPQANLDDPELKSGLVYTDAHGLPRPVTGSFASVYRMHCQNSDFALRLFLRNIHDQHERYALISDFVQHDDLPYTVTFDFLRNGIKIMGEWLPALKMEWVEGEPFDDYIVENLANPEKLGQLLTKFVSMMEELRQAGIAHGDLQHGNIIMCENEIRLVDYDGMFVPSMNGYLANELGHRNYQHPQRSEKHFGAYLDNFAAWVIYTSVRALQIDSQLLHQLGGGDDCLLFRQADFVDPLHSASFSALERHGDAELRRLGRFLRVQLKQDPANVPYLHLPVPEIKDEELEPISQSAPAVRRGPRLLRGNLPDWLQDENADILVSARANDKNQDFSTQAPNVVPQSWTVPAKPAQPAKWVKPSAAPPAAHIHASVGTSPIPHAVPGRAIVGNSAVVGNSAAAQSSLTYSAAPGGYTASSTGSQTAGPFPPELSMAHLPRKVTFSKKCGKTRPEIVQWLMILNPTVWIMLSTAFTASTFDNDLRVHGADYSATVTNVHRYEYKGKHTDLSLQYTVNGVQYNTTESIGDDFGKYTTGSHVMVHALPSQPTYTEPLGQPTGTRQSIDLFYLLVWLLLNLLCEHGIWNTARKQRRLAEIGEPVQAFIERLWVESGSKEQKYYKATISYHYSVKTFRQILNLSEHQYHGLKAGTSEIILCDPRNPKDVAIYKYCLYHPIIVPSLIPPLTPLSSLHSITQPPTPIKKSLPRP